MSADPPDPHPDSNADSDPEPSADSDTTPGPDPDRDRDADEPTAGLTSTDRESDSAPTAEATDAIPDDPDRAAILRTIAAEVRQTDADGAEQVAAILQRVSDCYDPEETSTPATVHRNMRHILRVREEGGLDR